MGFTTPSPLVFLISLILPRLPSSSIPPNRNSKQNRRMLFRPSVYSFLNPDHPPSFRTERADSFFPIRFLFTPDASAGRMGRPAQRGISLLFDDARALSSTFERLSVLQFSSPQIQNHVLLIHKLPTNPQ